ncbi:MAG TPA: isopentenyl phosphate kinase [Thermoplasmata archaeon]|nr:isopentenyl phosphate kinase [Thermoplasmata archaeon]
MADRPVPAAATRASPRDPTDSGGAGPLVIVKLGGSIITRKREVERIRPKVLQRLAGEAAVRTSQRVILLHGAGSFGHAGAHRWGLASPPAAGSSSRDRVRGAAIVQAEVRRLHGKVLSALLEAHANPLSIPAALVAQNRSGALERFDAGPFARALEAGALPVSFGDVVPDSDWGFSILSADGIAVALARALRPARVVFVSDVPGILRGGRGGREIFPHLDRHIVEGIPVPSGSVDVTGGIVGKAKAMLELAEIGVDAGLISGLSDGALSRAIRGEAVYGSWAKAAHRPASDGASVPDERPRSVPS